MAGERVSIGAKIDFESIKNAAEQGKLGLMLCREKASGKIVTVLVGVKVLPNGQGDTFYEMIPLAKMFGGNPYDEVETLS